VLAYLEELDVELRKYQRTQIDEDLTFRDSEGKSHRGRACDISLGGMFIETQSVLPFGAHLTVQIRLKGSSGTEALDLPAISRWSRTDGMGIQFGNMGARETHIITEVSKRDD
jgi:c-di-GMP-binding flagellar brake protein YcgR